MIVSPFYISTIDEYGYSYDAASFQTIEETRAAISALEDSLEDATMAQSYKIEAAIAELKGQLQDAQEAQEDA